MEILLHARYADLCHTLKEIIKKIEIKILPVTQFGIGPMLKFLPDTEKQ